MFWQNIIAGFSLGLAGSGHCLVMCGPLAMLLPVRALSGLQRILALIFYQLGRISIYVLLGTLAGSIGWAGSLAGLQQAVSITGGVVILYYSYRRYYSPKQANGGSAKSYSVRMLNYAVKAFQPKNLAAYFFPGIINGLFPCGMLYMAIVVAMAMRSSISGAVFMASFGAGTVPMMLTAAFFATGSWPRVMRVFRRAIPILSCLVGLLLVVRGLGLGIPYLSPAMHKSIHTAIVCRP